MHILQLCHKPPVPAVDGGCIAMVAASKAMMDAGMRVKILAIETHKHPFFVNKGSEAFVEKTNMETLFINTNIKALDAFLNLFSNESYNIKRFYDKSFEEKIINTLKDSRFDVIQLESLFVAPYVNVIRKYSPKSQIVLRAHNLEHIIWEKSAANAGFLKSLYLKLLATRLKKYELEAFEQADGIIAISGDDEKKIKGFVPSKTITSIPVNVDVERLNNPNNNNLFYIGAFDWEPNKAGINWFLDEVWPSINQGGSGIKFNIAGRKMKENLKPVLIQNVNYQGEVSDARSFMNEHGIMVVPLFAGSGIRVKILEAMALGKTVISTSLGAEGIGCRPEKEILIANTAAEFIAAIQKCSNNPDFIAEIGRNASNFVKDNFSTQKLGAKFFDFYKFVQI